MSSKFYIMFHITYEVHTKRMDRGTQTGAASAIA